MYGEKQFMNKLNYDIVEVPKLKDYEALVKEMLERMESSRNTYVPNMYIRDFYNLGGFFKWVNFSYITNDVPEVPLSNNKVSVCILTYNNVRYIRECIQAIREFVSEVIIIDSGSTDGTKEIIEELADTVIYVENTLGFDEKRNLGIKVANGQWILMLDSDEALSKDAFVALRKYMTWADETLVDIFWLPRYWVKAFDVEPMYHYVGDLCLWPDPQARLFRKDANCIYQGKLHEEIYSHTARKACFIHNDSCVIYHFKYWYYKNEDLYKIINERKLLHSTNKDDIQLLPWEYDKECIEVSNHSLDESVLKLLKQLCKGENI